MSPRAVLITPDMIREVLNAPAYMRTWLVCESGTWRVCLAGAVDGSEQHVFTRSTLETLIRRQSDDGGIPWTGLPEVAARLMNLIYGN